MQEAVHQIGRRLISTDCTGFTNNITNFTNATAALASSFYAGLSLDQSSVQALVLQGDSASLVNLLVNGAIPFIVALVVFFFITIGLVLCCVFQKSCPPCQSWRRNFELRPYSRREMSCTAYVFLFFILVTAAGSIFTLTTIAGFQSATTGTKCSIQSTVKVAINGDAGSWGGFQNIVYQLGNISGALTTASSRVTASLGADNNWLVSSMSNLLKQVYALYPRYNNYQLSSPNANSFTRVNPISSEFIMNRLGPVTANGTMTYGLNFYLTNTKRMTDRGFSIDSAARAMQAATPSMQNNFNFSINQLNMFISQLEVFQGTVNNFTSTVFEEYFTYGTYGLQAGVGLILASSLLGIVGMAATHCVGIINCRMIVHFTWISLMVLYYLVIAFAYVAIPGGAVLSGFCGFYNSTLYNQSQFRLYGAFASQNVINKASACLFEKGDILGSFGCKTELNSLYYMFTNITDFNNMQQTSQNVYVNLGLVSNEITSWNTVLTNRMTGLWSDKTADNTDNNPQLALAKFSVLTNMNTNSMPHTGCPDFLDEWTFEPTNCSSSRRLSGATIATNNIADGATVCLNFDSGNSKPSLVTIGNRYKTMNAAQSTAPPGVSYLACQAIYNEIISQATALLQYRDSRINLFNSMLSDLTSIRTSYTSLVSNLNNFVTNVATFQTNVAALDTLIQDKLTGVVFTTNCSAIATALGNVNNQMCVSFKANFFLLAVGFMVLAGSIFGAVVSGHIFAVRYSRIDLQEQVFPSDEALDWNDDDQKSDLSAFQ